jgi:hypothetical protein
MRSLVLIALVACAGGPPTVPSARFANARAVSAVDDRRDVPKAPAERIHSVELYNFDGSFLRPITHTMELPRARRALGVNALDEVPDSTWFTNRIGVRAVTPDELRTAAESPEQHKPWTIESTKVGGINVGFIMKDARGVRFILKFDEHGFPEGETAADAIIARLLWACGYNVPDDHVVYFKRSDLVLAKDAIIKDVFGNERPLTPVELDRRFERVVVSGDGQIRALASRFLDGTRLGGHPQRGVRADDPNDRIPHELRRDLRGLQAIYAWLDNVDVKEDNTLDMWVADPADASRHYVKHYLIDFGKGLGVTPATSSDLRRGQEYRLDWDRMFESLFTLGLARRSWEVRTAPGLRGIGVYDATDFDPARWRPNMQGYLPFLTSDRIDRLWAAKLIIRFTPEQLRAAVEAGRYTDPKAAAYMLDTLVARQRVVAAYWFARTSPLDGFTIGAGDELCFDDLALVHHLTERTTTEYAVTAYNRDGRPARDRVRFRPSAASSCTPSLAYNGYTIVRIETARPSVVPPVFVHVDRDPVSRKPRVIGVWRQ